MPLSHYMKFQPNAIYHIYNQGNNRQQIFFSDENYLFFIKKMRAYLLPYGDLLCYCLMPNHFHWLFYVREVCLLPSRREGNVGVTASNPDITFTPASAKLRTLNDSIGILLRSYTRAINNQEERTGCLFREETKAKDGWENFHLQVSHPDYGKLLNDWELYGIHCFHYIHLNPVAAKMVDHPEDWPYSSCRDFSGARKGTLCNKQLAIDLLGLI